MKKKKKKKRKHINIRNKSSMVNEQRRMNKLEKKKK